MSIVRTSLHAVCALALGATVSTSLRAENAPETTAPTTNNAAATPVVVTEKQETVTTTTAPKNGKSLLAILNNKGEFKTLLKVIDAAGLKNKLETESGPFTFFAPTDAAFDKLPAGTVDNLLKPENRDKLVQLINYHLVSGKVSAADLAKRDEIGTLEGDELDIEASDDGKNIQIDDAKIVSADVPASNGVVHVIDRVLQP